MAGQKTSILINDYNEIQAKIALVMGVGSEQYGYGQQVFSGQLAANSTVTLVQWKNLRDDLLRARQHQLGGNLGNLLPIPSTSTEVTESARAAYLALANLVSEDQNRLITPPAGESNKTNLVPAYQRTTPWNGTLTQTVTISFEDANAARNYFNSGSRIYITPVYLPSYGSAKDANWKLMFDHVASVSFNHTETTFTGSGPASGTTIGWYDLTTTDQKIFEKVSPSFEFTGNVFSVYARQDASKTQLILTLNFVDGFAGPPDDNVGGVLTTIVEGLRAYGFNVSVPQPAATTGGLQGGAPVIPVPPTPPEQGVLGITPTALNYNFQAGGNQTQTLYLKNLGNNAIVVNSLGFDVPDGISGEVVGTGILINSGVSLNDTSYSIAAKQQIPIQIKLSAASELVGNITVTAHSNNSSVASISASLIVSVAAVAPGGQLNISPLNTTYSMNVNGTVSNSFVMSNIGGTSITVNSIAFTAPSNVSGGIDGTAFTIEPGTTKINNTNYVLAPGASTSISITVRATAVTNSAISAVFTASNSSNISQTAILTISSTEYIPPSNPRYSILAVPSTVGEPGTVNFTVTGTDVSPGTQVYCTVTSVSGNITSQDFSEGLEKSVVLGAGGSASFSKTVLNDNIKEGNEVFIVQVRTDNYSGPIVAYTDPITIVDSGAPTQYSVVASPASVNEGDTISFGISASDFTGTMYWSMSGANITSSDFTDGSLNGSVVISNGYGTVTKTVSADSLTEGSEVVLFELRTGGIGGPVVASTNVTISDSSTSIVIPSLTRTFSTGGPFTISIPQYINRIEFNLNGAGGANGGVDAGGGGGRGGTGRNIIGRVNVSPGQTVTVYVGGQGAAGGQGFGGNGGAGYNSGYGGGDGGNRGPSGVSGAGGGGGAATCIFIDGAIVAVAGGGGGGGGAGRYSNGQSASGGNLTNEAAVPGQGRAGGDHPTDGGGGGGGGGGYPAGKGGAAGLGDNGGDNGATGHEWTSGTTITTGVASQFSGSATISYGPSINN